jgi:hypothetical protein
MADAAWVTAWASIGAAVGTVGTLIVGVRVYGRRVEQQQRTQASKIYVSPGKDLTAVVHNYSDLPIYQLHVEFVGRPQKLIGFDWDDILLGGESKLMGRAGRNFLNIDKNLKAWEAQSEPLDVGLRFTDSAGYSWHREAWVLRKTSTRPAELNKMTLDEMDEFLRTEVPKLQAHLERRSRRHKNFP